MSWLVGYTDGNPWVVLGLAALVSGLVALFVARGRR